MSDQQDILSQSLLKLEDELKSFGTVRSKLKEASEQLEKADIELKQLAGETKKAIVAVEAVTDQTVALSKALIPLAKAIEGVNFPLRLDKIDMAVSTQASTLATFQGTTERGINDLNNEVKRNGKSVLDGFASMGTAMGEASKRDLIIIGLLIFNALILLILSVMAYMKH